MERGHYGHAAASTRLWGLYPQQRPTLPPARYAGENLGRGHGDLHADGRNQFTAGITPGGSRIRPRITPLSPGPITSRRVAPGGASVNPSGGRPAPPPSTSPVGRSRPPARTRAVRIDIDARHGRHCRQQRGDDRCQRPDRGLNSPTLRISSYRPGPIAGDRQRRRRHGRPRRHRQARHTIPNTYTGGTTVLSGTLQVSNTKALPGTGVLTVGGPATVVLSASGTLFGSNAAGQAVSLAARAWTSQVPSPRPTPPARQFPPWRLAWAWFRWQAARAVPEPSTLALLARLARSATLARRRKTG